MPFWRPRGCVLWLDFLEPSGNVAYDKSGYGNHGTIYGAQRVRALGRYGLEFDGVDDYVEVPDSDSLRLDTFTICALFKSAKYDGAAIRPLAKKGYAFVWEKFNYAFNLRGPGLAYSLIIGDGTNYEALVSDQIEPNTWHFGCGIYDGSTLKIYHDGELFAEKDVGAVALYKSDDSLWISRPSDALNGVVALVRIYNRALSEREIKANHAYFFSHVKSEV